MARDEQDREDLLREATALVERAELSLPGEAEHLVAGFRRGGGLSLFFGADPVYQFNAGRQLRRAFVAGTLFKAERGRLIALERRREPDRVVLLRRELNDEETAAFLAAMSERLNRLRNALSGPQGPGLPAAGKCRVVGQVPADADMPGRVKKWLETLGGLPTIAEVPHAG